MLSAVWGNHFRILGLLLQYAQLPKVFVASVFLLTTLGNTCLDRRQWHPSLWLAVELGQKERRETTDGLSSDYISGIAEGVAALRRRFS
jgi:hypothetical protein